jgi:hypothetical protein
VHGQKAPERLSEIRSTHKVRAQLIGNDADDPSYHPLAAVRPLRTSQLCQRSSKEMFEILSKKVRCFIGIHVSHVNEPRIPQRQQPLFESSRNQMIVQTMWYLHGESCQESVVEFFGHSKTVKDEAVAN